MPRVSEATKAENRDRLLAAAASEFATRGLGGARIDDISLAAGLAKGTIYNYFDSKEQVFREVVAAWTARITEERVPVSDDAPVGEQLLALVEADMAVMADMEEFARAAFRELLLGADADGSDLLPSTDPLDDVLMGLMERAQRRGELRSDRTPEQLVQLFAAVVNGLLVERWIPGSSLALDDIARLAVDQYLDGAGS